MKKRVIALWMAVMMAGAAVTGCGGTESTAVSESSSAVTNESAAAESGEMVEIDIIARQLGTASHPDNKIWQELDPRLQANGVKANIEFYPSTDYAVQCTTLIAGGEYPDMMEWWNTSYPQDLEDLSNDGLLRPLDDLIEEYGPNIRKVRTDENSTFYRNSEDGKIYGIPARSQDLGNLQCYAIRKDWLDALGLDVPDSTEELYEVLKAFSTYDADGDGDVSDTIPLGIGSSTHFYNPTYMALSEYGVVYNQWNVTEEGNLEYWAVMDETKEAIAFARKLYQEGLMEPEYTLLDRDQLWDNMANGMYGACAWYVDRLDPSTSATAAAFFEKNPDCELIILNPFPDEEGIRRIPRMVNTQPMLIFSDTSEEEAIACIKFLDYLYSDEGGDLVDLGIKGEDWIENEDGTKESLISADEQSEIGVGMYNWMAKRSNFAPTVNEYSKEVAQMMLEASVENPVLTITTEAGVEYSSGLNSLVETSITSMIMDEGIDLDSAFENFVSTWYGSGGQEWTDEINAAYKQ